MKKFISNMVAVLALISSSAAMAATPRFSEGGLGNLYALNPRVLDGMHSMWDCRNELNQVLVGQYMDSGVMKVALFGVNAKVSGYYSGRVQFFYKGLNQSVDVHSVYAKAFANGPYSLEIKINRTQPQHSAITFTYYDGQGPDDDVLGQPGEEIGCRRIKSLNEVLVK